MTCDRHRNSYCINLETANQIMITLVIIIIIVMYCSLCRQYIEGMCVLQMVIIFET